MGQRCCKESHEQSKTSPVKNESNSYHDDSHYAIFTACDADRSGSLDIFETKYALQGLGLYPKKEDIEEKMKELNFNFPLSLPNFPLIVDALKKHDCMQGLCTIPYARRGLSLKQLKAVHTGLIETGWLQLLCDEFNHDNENKIKEGEKFAMSTNLYAIDKCFVQNTTSKNDQMRSNIPEEVLKASKVPGVPDQDCSFAQLINPEGLSVDFFVSHYWGHPFEKTMAALSNFAESVYRQIGKNSANEVVFWICLFALNQHKAKEEVGETPEEGPFNAALANSEHGAVMVVDKNAQPMQRIWCLYEVSRAKHFDKHFQLIVDEGIVESSSVETIKEISKKLLTIRAYSANASDDMDKLKILYRILDTKAKNIYGATFDYFKLFIDDDTINEDCFQNFDAYVCSLIGVPLLNAGLKLKSKEICYEAIGMGAIVTVNQMKELDVGIDVQVNTRYGNCGLPILFARLGRLEELQYVLDVGADIDGKDDKNGRTALHWAANNGQMEVVTFLINRGATVGKKDGRDRTALILAARAGNTKIVKLLLEHCAAIDEKDDVGCTALHAAVINGGTETVAVLLDGGAAIDHKTDNGFFALHLAAVVGHLGVLELLLDSGADIETKQEGRTTALHSAAIAGHPKIVGLLLDRGADINAKLNDGSTALQLAIYNGQTEIIQLLCDHGAK